MRKHRFILTSAGGFAACLATAAWCQAPASAPEPATEQTAPLFDTDESSPAQAPATTAPQKPETDPAAPLFDVGEASPDEKPASRDGGESVFDMPRPSRDVAEIDRPERSGGPISFEDDWLGGLSRPGLTGAPAATPTRVGPGMTAIDPGRASVANPDSPVDPSTAQNQERFTQAREAFTAGDYNQALTLVDETLARAPQAPMLHEFRGLSLLALEQFDEAAQAVATAIADGPGWNWSTMISHYDDPATYTRQLRALEEQVKADRTQADPLFLLAYHYLVQGHREHAKGLLNEVAALRPEDRLSTSILQYLDDSATSALASGAEAPPVDGPRSVREESLESTLSPTQPPDTLTPANVAAVRSFENPGTVPPPRELVGTWTAAGEGLQIILTLNADGTFRWQASPATGPPRVLEGNADFRHDDLTLMRYEGTPLSGEVTMTGPDAFQFDMSGGAAVPTLHFKR